MFHVLDHTDVVYTGELSQATQYVIDHYGKKLDDAIRSGIMIAYSDAFHKLICPRCDGTKVAHSNDHTSIDD